ncbi:uridine kinase-like protein 4 [Capsicum chacoense]
MDTLIRDAQTTKHDFVFYADRLIRLVVEHGLGHLLFTEKQVITPIGSVYSGVDFCKRLCGVSVIRSQGSIEKPSHGRGKVVYAPPFVERACGITLVDMLFTLEVIVVASIPPSKVDFVITTFFLLVSCLELELSEPESYGCLLELTWNGQKPLSLGGTTRTYLEDGDEVTFYGYCQGNGYKFGFESCSEKIVPSPQ